MAGSRRMLSLSHGDTGETKRKTNRKVARRRNRKWRGGRKGPALASLHKAGHMAAACWITNSGNLERPPVKPLVSFPCSSRLSNTITSSHLFFFPSLPLTSLALLCFDSHSFPLICYSSKYLFWQDHSVVNFFLIHVKYTTHHKDTN